MRAKKANLEQSRDAKLQDPNGIASCRSFSDMKKDLGKQLNKRLVGCFLTIFVYASLMGVGFASWSNGGAAGIVADPFSISINLAYTYSIIDLDTSAYSTGYNPFIVCKDGFVVDETINATGTLTYFFRYNPVSARPSYQWSDETTHFNVALSLKNAYQFQTSDTVIDSVTVGGLLNKDTSGFLFNGAHEVESKLIFENKTTSADGQLFSISYTFNSKMLDKMKDSSGNLIADNIPKFYLRLTAIKEST